ncbi:ribonuclease III [Methylocystis bryophila]|uniref:Ribonuclease 3 n=1 Tax=Methylocystis bryophila TaxID=655015 RepID=A0A1W6MQB7_9HYPH|nr:ribonuclease III [Methylocystis bryophila]ARN79777.1 ribonuclease III [Methylocystis bryophila]BDV39657.1 ribonuclease 3 [Methylocystis bryophila]
MNGDPECDVAAVEQSIGHVFADRSLLAQALTHASAATPRSGSYERLEFLGDRVLGLGVAHMLMETYAAESEGPLSHRLAALVRKETCAEVAREWGVGPFIRMGEGEVLSGGREKPAILGDVCEAIIGAVFLDAGAAAAEAVVRRAFEPRMLAPSRRLRDPKTVLQEWAQGRKLPAPTYRLAARSGPDHAPRFEIRAEIDGFEGACGAGSSKRAAEQAAAQSFLHREGIEPEGAEPS